MEVSPRLQQALRIDTNISYSLDMSRFPGLDDPKHQSQPALLIATPESQGNTGQDTMSEVIPSPTVDVPGSADMLEDILSVIEKHDSDFGARIRTDNASFHGDAPTGTDTQVFISDILKPNRSSQIPVTQQLCSMQPNNEQRCFVLKHQGSVQTTPVNTTCMSRYAMEMIFNKLIYPDVSLGRSFSLDTLVQSTASESTRQRSVFSSTGDYVTKLNRITGLSLRDTPVPVRYGKRKRVSYDVSCNDESNKRVRLPNAARTFVSPGVWNKNAPLIHSHQERRLVLT